MRLNRFAACLLTATALTAPALAQELPTTPTVVSGVVNITTTPGVMTMTQPTDAAIVNWNTFSIGTGGLVNISQPNANAVLLNRVTGDTPSTIAGSLTATGQVFVVNPNGIAITSSGVVNTSGFTASTLGISDADFLSGTYRFEGDGSSATVSNAGRIRIEPGGYAALLGGRVDNSGSIVAPLGKVGLGAAELITLDIAGDGFLKVAVPSNVAGDDPLISNSGSISADGGYVQMSVAAAQDAARNVINLSGTVEAKSFSGRSGAIVLSGDGGQVTVTGTLDTSTTSAPPPRPKVQIVPIPAPRPNFRGGDITVTGNAIRLADANFDASGFEGGGDIRIGGDFHGNGLIPTATTLDVDFLTSIKADALIDGNGGTVVLWSDDRTAFDGNISARGAGQDGTGGFVEVSGKRLLAMTGDVTTWAPSGRFGTLLLDPYNIIIGTFGSDFNNTGSPNYTPTGDDSLIDAAALMAWLDGGNNVVISTGGAGSPGTQAGDITLSSSLTWTGGAVLTLNAFNDIFADPLAALSIVAPDGSVVLVAGNDLIAGMEIEATNVTLDGGNVEAGVITATGLTDIIARLGYVDLNSEVITGNLRIRAATDITPLYDQATIDATGDIEMDAGRDLFLGAITIDAGGDITLTAERDANLAGTITAAGHLSVTAGRNIDLTEPEPDPFPPTLTGVAALYGGSVFLQAGGTLFLRPTASVTSALTDIVINTGTFTNLAGPEALIAKVRHIIYSQDWEQDTRGGIPGVNLYNRTFTSSPPATTLPGQDVFVYARQPVLTITIDDAMRMYFSMFELMPDSVSLTGLVNGDTVAYATDGDFTNIVDTTLIDADVGLYPGALRPLALTSPVGYAITYVGGNLTVTPAPLSLIANSFSKTYGDSYAFLGTEFSAVGLRGSDVVGTVTLTSLGADGTATVSGSPYAILISNATGGDFSNYDITYVNGALTVTPRALVITADDLLKLFSTDLVFTGTEFTTSGLVNGDTVSLAVLTSPGQPPQAPPGYYPILIDGATGSGLDNYAITYVPGTLTVGSPTTGTRTILPQIGAPADRPTILGLADPADVLAVLPDILAPEITPGEAEVTLQTVEGLSQTFAATIAECERQLETSGDEGAYLTCASDALEAYADELELLDLPPELKASVRVIRETAQRVRTAASNPNPRAAVAEARQAVSEMVDFVREQTALVRAVDPDTQALLQQSGEVMTQALNQLELQLVSAVEI